MNKRTYQSNLNFIILVTETQRVIVEPSKILVREGESIQFVCKVPIPIRTCEIIFPSDRSEYLRPGFKGSNSNHEYYGTKLEVYVKKSK
jgi:hypothetical protein